MIFIFGNCITKFFLYITILALIKDAAALQKFFFFALRLVHKEVISFISKGVASDSEQILLAQVW